MSKPSRNHSTVSKEQTSVGEKYLLVFFSLLQYWRNQRFTEHRFLEDTDMKLLSIFYFCQMTGPLISPLTPKLYCFILSLPFSHHLSPPNFPLRHCFSMHRQQHPTSVCRSLSGSSSLYLSVTISLFCGPVRISVFLSPSLNAPPFPYRSLV